MSQYQAATSAEVKPDIASFFESFYSISDTPDAHTLYSEQFTNDAVLIMGSNKANGQQEILKLRQNMWEKVASRSHKPARIFPAENNSEELMLYGTVDYGLKDGRSVQAVDWAARAVMVNVDGQMKMDFYQVYLDSAAMSRAK